MSPCSSWMTLSEVVREMIEKCLPEYKQKAAAEGEKLRAGKCLLQEQVEEAALGLLDDLRRGRLVLFVNELTGPKALALAELIERLRPEGENADPLAAKLRQALLQALKAAPDVAVPEPPSKPKPVRGYLSARPSEPRPFSLGSRVGTTPAGTLGTQLVEDPEHHLVEPDHSCVLQTQAF